MGYQPIRLPGNTTFWLPTQKNMIKEIQEIDNLIGAPNTAIVLHPNSPKQACLFAFLSLLGNGVLTAIKTALTPYLAILDLLILALEYQVIQAEMGPRAFLAVEKEVVRTLRAVPQSVVQSIYTQVQSALSYGPENAQTEAIKEGLAMSEAMKCLPVASFFETLSAPLRAYNARLNELDYLIDEAASIVGSLRLALQWAKQKKRFLQWLIDSCQFTVDNRN